MKKLERIKLSTLSSEVNVLGRSESANSIGGQYTGSDGNTYYTGSEMETMMDNGTWTGGFVNGMGYMGSVVDVSPSDVTPSDTLTVDNTLQALDHYLFGNGEPVNIGDDTTLGALSNEGFVNAHDSINNGGSYENNQFGIDMTSDVFHIGNTTVGYEVFDEYIEYTLFKGDGFWDPNFIGEDFFDQEADGKGSNLELLNGTPYEYNSVIVRVHRY